MFGGTGIGIGDIGYILEEIALDQGELNVDIECPVAVVTVQEISVDVASIEVL